MFSRAVYAWLSALLWPQQIPVSNSKIFKQRKDDEEALQRLNFDQIELEFRNRVSILNKSDEFINIATVKSFLNWYVVSWFQGNISFWFLLEAFKFGISWRTCKVLIYRVILKTFVMTIWFVIRLHFFLSLSNLDNLGCYKPRLHVFLCVDEEELPESEENFPDLWSSPGRIYQPGGPQVHPVSVHCPYVWPALQADDGEVRGGNSGFEIKSTC